MSGGSSMTDKSAPQRPSLIERAADIYDFGTALRHGPAAAVATPIPAAEIEGPQAPEPSPEPAAPEQAVGKMSAPAAPAPAPAPASRLAGDASRLAGELRGERHPLDREALRRDGFVDPDSPPTSLSEEFRIIKRQLLAQAFAPDAGPRDRMILVNSAHPGDGKTWMSINLALSLSAESDIDVLLIDGDFGKPSIAGQLGLPDGPGFMDALADPALDVADIVVRTDIPSLSVLRAGRQ
ncbi:MAG: capsular biosynthesis protein, partial [Sphingobium sp.]